MEKFLKNQPTVVVLVFTHKPSLDWYEEISLRQCEKVLGGRHPIRLVCPEGMDTAACLKLAPSLVPEFVPPRFLASIEAYNRFKISSWLYRRFHKFDFILTYELDAFVFRDELLDWCREGWDYIGAPWFQGWQEATPDSPFIGVGNSGFSLRRIDCCLRISTAVEWVQRLLPRRLYHSEKFRRLVPSVPLRNLMKLTGYTDQHEDDFWARFVPKAYPDFKVATYERAKLFSLEANVRNILANGQVQVPFGCHAWHRCDTDFWRPLIQAEGHRWPKRMAASLTK
jgi:hypothetical protein